MFLRRLYTNGASLVLALPRAKVGILGFKVGTPVVVEVNPDGQLVVSQVMLSKKIIAPGGGVQSEQLNLNELKGHDMSGKGVVDESAKQS